MPYPKKWEYTVHRAEHVPLTGGIFDVAEWMNELGQDGWEICEIVTSVADTGTVTSDGSKVTKIVIQAMSKRAILETQDDSTEGKSQ